MIDHPVPGVGVVVVSEGAILLVRRGSGAHPGSWAVPGGKVRWGESWREAAVRETKEETGLDVVVGEVVWVGESLGPGQPPAWHFALVDFAAEVAGGSLAAGDDVTEARFVPLGELATLTLTPGMHDLLVALGLVAPPVALPVHRRPFVSVALHTDQLPATPQRDVRIPARGWIEAPEELLSLGDELGEAVEYKRRIGRFLLWRAGPPVGEAWYMAIDATDLSIRFRFRLSGRTGEGLGADQRTHHRFRTWKESLLESSREEV